MKTVAYALILGGLLCLTQLFTQFPRFWPVLGVALVAAGVGALDQAKRRLG